MALKIVCTRPLLRSPAPRSKLRPRLGNMPPSHKVTLELPPIPLPEELAIEPTAPSLCIADLLRLVRDDDSESENAAPPATCAAR